MAYDQDTLEPLHGLTDEGRAAYRQMLESLDNKTFLEFLWEYVQFFFSR